MAPVEVPCRLILHIEKTVAQNDADCVPAGFEHFGYVVSNVKHAAVVAGVTRIENVVADALSVQIEFVVAQSGNIGAGLFYVTVEMELAAQKRGRLNRDVRAPGDPLGYPVVFNEQAHFPAGDRAFNHFAVLVPDADFPETLLPRCKRFAVVVNLHGFVRVYFAAVPKIALDLRGAYLRRRPRALDRPFASKPAGRTRLSNSIAAGSCLCPTDFPSIRRAVS